MDDRKSVQSEDAELDEKDSGDSGSFFKKYRLSPPEHASNPSIFVKYAPPRSNRYEGRPDQTSAAEPDLSDSGDSVGLRVARRAPIALLWVVLFAVLIVTGSIVLQAVSNTKANRLKQAAERNIQPSGAPSDGTSREEALKDSASELDSAAMRSLDEKTDGNSRLAPSRSLTVPSTAFPRNIVLARAREFEDRGMLLQAEQEYRMVASSFPEDAFSQSRLSRVQSILSANRENEISRVSRESGLQKFRMSDYVGAEKDLAAAVSSGRADTATLYALGMSYVKLGNYGNAQLALDRCLADNSGYAPALVGLAQVSAATGNKDRALSLLERAADLGGGAEFTPAKIKEMISGLIGEQQIPPSGAAPSVETPKQSEPTFFARATHWHALSSCTGDLKIINSVVHFTSSKPSHSFHILSTALANTRAAGERLHLIVNGTGQVFTLKERLPQEFVDAVRRLTK